MYSPPLERRGVQIRLNTGDYYLIRKIRKIRR